MMNKKNSWRVALDYYNQEKNAPVFKTQKYEGNDLYGKTRHEGYKAWQLSASYAPEKNVGITTAPTALAATSTRGRKSNHALKEGMKWSIILSKPKALERRYR